METGEHLKLLPQEVKEYYKSQISGFLEQLKLKCLQYKIDFVEADISKGFLPILQTWMVKRQKMM